MAEGHSWTYIITLYWVIHKGVVVQIDQQISSSHIQGCQPQGKVLFVVVFQGSGGLKQEPTENSH